MKTGFNFHKNTSNLNSAAYYPTDDMPNATVKISDACLNVPERFGSCYVIYEEEFDDSYIDENVNNNSHVSYDGEQEMNQNIENIGDRIEDSTRNDRVANFRNLTSGLFNLNESVDEAGDECDDVPRMSGRLSTTFSSRVGKLYNQSSTPSSGSTFLNQQQQQRRHDSANASMPDVKSGHLVLIISDNDRFVSPMSNRSSVTSKRSQSTRCPVIVKIYGRGYDKYAIISGTRRQPPSSSICLKLKHSYVTYSPTNPSRFTIVTDSSEGKTFTFEATCPDSAVEWKEAFSTGVSNNRDSSFCDSSHGSIKTSKSKLQDCQYGDSKRLSQLQHLSQMKQMPVLCESEEE